MNNKALLNILFSFLAFALPFTLFFCTHSNSMGFADAAEFALVTKIASVAHGPGTPSYVFLGWLWSNITSPFIGTHFLRMVLFSIVSTSSACLLMYMSVRNLLQRAYPNVQSLYCHLLGLTSALVFATGFTGWYWASNIEVYAFHVFTFSLLLYGVLEYNYSRKTKDIVVAAIGLALGLANHHLTIIVFIPFILAFIGSYLFADQPVKKQPVKKKKAERIDTGPSVFAFCRTRQFWIFSATTAVITMLFYGWMMMRASVPLPFKFGSPDTFSRLLYHVDGGAWMKNTTEEVEGIVGMRFPYFAWLFIRQYGLFTLLIVAGLIELFRKKWYRFALVVILYFILLLSYQLRLNQIGDSDAYMLLPFYIVTFCVPFGAMWLMRWKKQSLVVIPILLAAQLFWNFSLADKRQFDLSETLMKSLDESSPKNSVIIISDWTLVSEYYYHRIAENFRPDLVVLNYDFKFTNYTMLKIMYPEFYKLIQPEYDAFVSELGKEHPYEIYNTGCTLNTPALEKAYRNLFYKITSVCDTHSYPLLYDPKSYVYFTDSKIVPANAYVSGCFIAHTKTNMGGDFLKLPFKWLDLPLIEHEPAAGDKLVDLQAMLHFHGVYYEAVGDTVNNDLARQSYEKIMALQAKMKENIPYIFQRQ